MGTKAVGALAAVLAALAGCDGGSNADAFGFDSIEWVNIDVRHADAKLSVMMRAAVRAVDETTCPPLDPALAITANGVRPNRLGLDANETDAILVFGYCRVYQLSADFDLPATTRTLRLDFLNDGKLKGSVELDIPEQTTMQLGAFSTTSVPLGGSFTADVTLTPAPAGNIKGSNCWYGGHCPRENPDCVPGEGYSGLLIDTTQPNPATIHISATVPDGSFTGARAMFLRRGSFNAGRGAAAPPASGRPPRRKGG